jgi:cytochrome c
MHRPVAMFADAFLVIFVLLGVPAGKRAAAEAGAEVFKKCRACHDVGATVKNKVGPLRNGIMGRQAGSIDGCNHSQANTAAGAKGGVWTAAVMLKYLENPVSDRPDQDGVHRPQEGERPSMRSPI